MMAKSAARVIHSGIPRSRSEGRASDRAWTAKDARRDSRARPAQRRQAPFKMTGPVPEAPPPEPILEAKHVALQFRGVKALDDVSFAVRNGELFSIIGPNGAGKTSIINCISGSYRPTAGSILYRTRDITQLGPRARATLGIGR